MTSNITVKFKWWCKAFLIFLVLNGKRPEDLKNKTAYLLFKHGVVVK